jgi:MFS transporter, DHA2 family, methylenomycin A resistance protein
LSMLLVASPPHASHRVPGRSRSGFTLAAAVLGFFVITLDAVVVNVALPSIRGDLGGGIAGLQWVVDGYTLMFAAMLLTAGALSDRIGARRAFAAGLLVSPPVTAVLLLAAGVALAAVAASQLLQPPRGSHQRPVTPA